MFQYAYTVACGKKLWLRIIPADRSIEMLDSFNFEYIRANDSVIPHGTFYYYN